MPKIFYFLFITTILLIVLMGFFFWSVYSDDIKDIIPAVKMEPPENYRIFETEEGKFVENSNVGLKFKVPDGWDVKKEEIQPDEWVINVMSPDIKFGEDGLLSEGCGFSAWVERDEILSNVVRDEVSNITNNSQGKEVIKISGHEAFEFTVEKKEWGKIIAVKVPVKDMVFMFDTLFRPETENRCSVILTEFLKEVNIE
jgi:hypothetical protein